MLIDSHQHFWQWSKGWFSRPEQVLSRDYLPVDFEPIAKALSIDKTIVVQTSPTVAETDFLLELGETGGFIGRCGRLARFGISRSRTGSGRSSF